MLSSACELDRLILEPLSAEIRPFVSELDGITYCNRTLLLSRQIIRRYERLLLLIPHSLRLGFQIRPRT